MGYKLEIDICKTTLFEKVFLSKSRHDHYCVSKAHIRGVGKHTHEVVPLPIPMDKLPSRSLQFL